MRYFEIKVQANTAAYVSHLLIIKTQRNRLSVSRSGLTAILREFAIDRDD